MKAIISVIGKDNVGILARVSNHCWKSNVNIVDVTQTILDEYFTMIMYVDLEELNTSFDDFKDSLIEEVPEMEIHIMREEIFKSMHEL